MSVSNTDTPTDPEKDEKAKMKSGDSSYQSEREAVSSTGRSEAAKRRREAQQSSSDDTGVDNLRNAVKGLFNSIIRIQDEVLTLGDKVALGEIPSKAELDNLKIQFSLLLPRIKSVEEIIELADFDEPSERVVLLKNLDTYIGYVKRFEPILKSHIDLHITLELKAELEVIRQKQDHFQYIVAEILKTSGDLEADEGRAKIEQLQGEFDICAMDLISISEKLDKGDLSFVRIEEVNALIRPRVDHQEANREILEQLWDKCNRASVSSVNLEMSDELKSARENGEKGDYASLSRGFNDLFSNFNEFAESVNDLNQSILAGYVPNRGETDALEEEFQSFTLAIGELRSKIQAHDIPEKEGNTLFEALDDFTHQVNSFEYLLKDTFDLPLVREINESLAKVRERQAQFQLKVDELLEQFGINSMSVNKDHIEQLQQEFGSIEESISESDQKLLSGRLSPTRASQILTNFRPIFVRQELNANLLKKLSEGVNSLG